MNILKYYAFYDENLIAFQNGLVENNPDLVCPEAEGFVIW